MFTDYYEILEISPNANSETIDRIFRYLAQRYHPDNPDTGDRPASAKSWRPIIRSKIRSNARSTIFSIKTIRASARNWPRKPATLKASNGMSTFRTSCCRCFMSNADKTSTIPASAIYELERLSGCPREHLEFHLWYLKEKGWIGRIENGMLAITVEGVDRANSEHRPKTTTKLLKDLNRTG